jgi:glycosyltransferase involved in cell wall biosynthesis
MQMAFFIPKTGSSTASGEWYNTRMLAALAAKGVAVTVVALESPVGETTLDADVAAKLAAKAAYVALEEATIPVIDAALFPLFNGLEAALAGRAFALVHHFTPYGRFLSEDDRAQRDAQKRALLTRMVGVIASNNAVAERIVVEDGVPSERVATILPGTDDAPRSVGSEGAGCSILSIGTLVRRKGYETLLRALARLLDLDWTLSLVGSPKQDPPYATFLEALAAELGISSRLRFLGEVPEQTLADLWLKADLFALASEWEGYGTAVANALKRGLPVAVTSAAATDVPLPPEAGVVVAPGDAEGLSKAMRRLIFDIPLRRQMAEAAWQAGKILPSWDAQAEFFWHAIGRS